MKSWQTVLLFLLAFFLGALAMWSMQAMDRQDSMVASDAFAEMEQIHEEMALDSDPFATMEQMHRKLKHDMDALMVSPAFPDFGMSSTWPSITQSRLLNSNQLTFEEDDDHVYFELDTQGNEVSHVDVSSEDGYLTIKAELESRTENGYHSSRLTRTMPVPTNANVDTLEIRKEDGQIIIRMKKG